MLTRRRVLVVDDSPHAVELVRTVLQVLGHDCHAVRTGGEAVIAARGFEPEIAILGPEVSDRNVRDLAGELRECSKRRLYVTAVMGQQGTDSLEDGIDQVISSPANEKKLRRMLWLAEVRRTSRATHVDDPR